MKKRMVEPYSFCAASRKETTLVALFGKARVEKRRRMLENQKVGSGWYTGRGG